MKTNEINIRDPFVLCHGGKYYLYGTRGATCWGKADGFDVYVGTDLENWEGPTACFTNDGSFWADRNYWAPEVHCWRGRYYMFASFKNERVRRGTAILVADDPMGPFHPHSDGCITPAEWECLDGTFYVSRAGRPYMVFCHEWVQAGDGEVCAVPLTDDLRMPCGEVKLLFRASEAKWCQVKHHSSGVSGCVTDGPFLWRLASGELVCLWASFSEGGYTEGMAVSDNGEIDGHFRQVEPLFMDDGGHGMIFRGLDGQLYLTLHTPNEHLQERPVFRRVVEKDGRLCRVDNLPVWFDEMHRDLHGMAERLTEKVTGWKEKPGVFRPEDYGYRGGKATASIQRALDAAGANGGTVLLSGGEYVSGTLVMHSNVRLKIGKGARLLASTDLADYPEHVAKRVTVQDTNMGMNQSLIFAEGCENIAICGPGEISGQGTQANFPGDETCHGTPGRPFVLRMIDCVGVTVRDIVLRDSPCWMENYLNCEKVLLENVTVRSQVNYNNDGIDIDGCRDVIVRGCDVQSGDDACCFKGASERSTERVLVEDCSFHSSCNALKVGTDTQGDFRQVLVRRCRIGGVEVDPNGVKHRCSDSAISLEMVDGGTLEDFLLEDLTIERAWSPVFLRLEDRGRVKPGDPKPGVGVMRRIAITHATGGDNGPRGSYMIGVPERPIEDVLLYDVQLRQHASTRPVLKENELDEMRGVYPDAHMIDSKGDAPAYTLWARHVHGLRLEHYGVMPEGAEKRPAFVLATDVE